MSVAKQTEAWNHTADLHATIVNLLAKHPRPANKFHPFKQKQARKKPRAKMSPSESFDALAMSF